MVQRQDDMRRRERELDEREHKSREREAGLGVREVELQLREQAISRREAVCKQREAAHVASVISTSRSATRSESPTTDSTHTSRRSGSSRGLSPPGSNDSGLNVLPLSSNLSDDRAYSPRLLDDGPSYQSYVSPLSRISPQNNTQQNGTSATGSSKLDAYYRDYDSYKHKRLSGHQRKYSDLSPEDSKERESSQKDHLSYKLDKLESRLRERERERGSTERSSTERTSRRYSDIGTTRASADLMLNKENVTI
jgi:hypothetical protein